MKKNISLHYHLLDKDREKVFLGLKFFRKEANLAGGTALCLQIGHRLSFDFDVFFQRELGRKDLRKLRRIFNIKEVKYNTSEHIKVVTFENVAIDLVYYPYRPLFRRIPTISLPLFSIKDIALDKAETIGRRALWRDYVDLFFLLKKEYISLEQIIKLAEKKFGVEFNPRLFLQQLIYFKDLQISNISWVEEKYSPYQIQNFLKKQVKDFRKRNII